MKRRRFFRVAAAGPAAVALPAVAAPMVEMDLADVTPVVAPPLGDPLARHGYAMSATRINRFKGMILKHAIPTDSLWMPYGEGVAVRIDGRDLDSAKAVTAVRHRFKDIA